MKIDYQVGDVVVCILDHPCTHCLKQTTVKRLELYTVAWLGESPTSGRIGVDLVEVLPLHGHMHFNGLRFRKAYTPEPGVELERNIDEPVKENTHAPH